MRIPIVIVTLLVAGCAADPKAGVLTGKVSVKGAPVTGGEVYVVGGTGNHEYAATAVIQPDGSYWMDRVPVGSVRLSVTPPLGANPGDAPPGPGIPPKFRDPRTSGLVLEIVPGSQTYDIKLD
ncbi:hypothetical protein [Gemmata sp.]|uniref:hypothetical protein n=1 Tax=Gemmata sp. TaxID=1914242 RepID=UPI003F721D1C